MMSFVNGPLGATVHVNGADVPLTDPRIRYCAPDGDIPTPASGLVSVPVLHNMDSVTGDQILVYLECHRAPDEVFAALQRKDVAVVCQGDSECLRPRASSAFAAALEASGPAPAVPPVHLHWCHTLSDALSKAAGGGRCRILVSNRDSVRTVMQHLRPDNRILCGDPVYDKRSRQVACVTHRDVSGTAHSSDVVRLDTGRCTTYGSLWRRLVESPSSWGSGECDTLIIMPDVCELVGAAASRRVRYQLISVGVAPTIYAPIAPV